MKPADGARMLSNEKYKKDTLSQKKYTMDFLNKKMKKNESEAPRYYVKGNHEAIINSTVFGMVQSTIDENVRIAYG